MRFKMICRAITLPFVSLLLAAAQAETSQGLWVSSWAAAQQLAEPQNMLAPEERHDGTLRQIVHLSAGGSQLQIRLSNVFGKTPLTIHSARVAVPVSASQPTLQLGTDRPVTFNGHDTVTLPPGAEYVSDSIDLRTSPLSNIAVSIQFADLPDEETSHPGSRATSYFLPGNATSDPDFGEARRIDHWFFLSEIDVRTARPAASIAILGDSITDGHGATTNGNDRWPDDLTRRLQQNPDTRNLALINLGIGGNRLLHDGLGPNAMARLDRDVIARLGVRYLILLEGINDLGTLTRTAEVSATEHEALVRDIIAAYQQIIRRAHQQNILVYGATILPDGGSEYYHPEPANEADRQAVNQWIRTSGHFDAVIDFEIAIKDPQQPNRLRPDYDSGDHLHPSPLGYKAMGDLVPLHLFDATEDRRRTDHKSQIP